MNEHQHLSVDDASRLAATAVAADLEYWARGVAVQGQVDLHDLVGFLDAVRAASIAQRPGSPTISNFGPN